MKRTREEEGEELCSMPPEIQSIIASYVTQECESVADYLHFHGSSRFLWTEYYKILDVNLLSLCGAKIERNRASLLKTLRAEYKDNMVEWSLFLSIVTNTISITLRIQQIADEDMRRDYSAEYVTKESGFLISSWLDFEGVSLHSFHRIGDQEEELSAQCLNHSGVVVMNALANRVSVRYEWEFYFNLKKKNKQGRHTTVFFPLHGDIDIGRAKLYIY